jgi:hypothetical protein
MPLVLVRAWPPRSNTVTMYSFPLVANSASILFPPDLQEVALHGPVKDPVLEISHLRVSVEGEAKTLLVRSKHFEVPGAFTKRRVTIVGSEEIDFGR